MASLGVLAIGVLGMVDLAGASIPASAYVALPLTVVASGLVVGAWYGRARWLVAIGVILSLALGVATTAERLAAADGSATWRPTSVDQLERTYTISLGDAVLDLSAVDFSGRSENVHVTVSMGDLTIIVPSNVDVRADVKVDVGSADVFGTQWSGIGQSSRTVADNGGDGPGGGELLVQATVSVGDVEVRR